VNASVTNQNGSNERNCPLLRKSLTDQHAALKATFREGRRQLLTKNWPGICPICEKSTRFYANGTWYRDQLVCRACGSIPRERALICVLQMLYPEWRDLIIHESSPGGGSSVKLKRECPSYVETQFDRSVPFGTVHATRGYRSENLEDQTFDNEMFDIVITQDVFEHLLHPDKAIQEIARTLRPGGAPIMTVPIVNKNKPSRRRAGLENGQIKHYLEAQYHSNPIDPEGSLVTVDWGYDIASYLSSHSGLSTTTFYLDDIERGIQAEYIEVIVSRKEAVPLV
jgi:Methyltransferase domain